MRFRSLEIKNLRAVENFAVDNLGDFVVVAGQNGCGKSCVFDAIRLLKSLYGGYQANEHLQWFGEFAINVQDQNALARMFRNPADPMLVSAEIEFSPQEVAYLVENASKLALPIAWQVVTGQPFDYYSFNQISVATQFAHLKPRVDSELENLVRTVTDALSPTIWE
jgi:energy-coupling factor transporter ATP-binding protein EcfA2